MTWLAARMAGAAGPYIAGGLVVVLLGLAGIIGWQAWHHQTLRAQVAQAEQAAATARGELAGCQADVTGLTGAIARQNDRIDTLTARAKAAASAADARALRVLQAERTRAANPPAGQGADAMNTWLAAALGPR